MNSGFQNKLYNYEVAPPAGVWNRITLELEDAALDNKFPSSLRNMEIIPALSAWQNISLALDESLFATDYSAKLEGLSVTPPKTSWQNIATILDESLLVNDYSTKLSSLAVAPPATTWNNILDQLDAKQEIVLSGKRKITAFYKYAVAASIISLLAWGAFQLSNNKKNETPLAAVTTPKEIPNSVPSNLATKNSTENIAYEEARNDAALEASKKTYAKLDAKFAKSKIKNVADFFFVPEIDEPGVRSIGNWQPPVPKDDFADRYFFLMTPEGNIIRISKKLSNIVGCVAGAEQDQECLDQLKKWQKKMASPKSVQSSGNLIEILNLANSLQESL